MQSEFLSVVESVCSEQGWKRDGNTLELPIEGAALLLAVDRPLDMMRTVVNVWSDSCGAAIVARTEGEEGPLAPLTAT